MRARHAPMILKNVREIARPQVVAILDLIKRSTGMSVSEIARGLGMSYMGVKQYCIELEKKGYLDTWRRPKAVGRPEKSYRLTEKAQALFPQMSNELTLEILQCIQQIYGATAVDKLLFNYFTRKAEYYARKVKGSSMAERAASLARLRDQEGYCSQVEYDPRLGFRITEYHTPFREIAQKFPAVWKMEESMFSRVLQSSVVRREERASGLTRFTFSVATVSVNAGADGLALSR